MLRSKPGSPMELRCAECQCAPQECIQQDGDQLQCKNCTKSVCCCVSFYNQPSRKDKQPSSLIRYLGHVKGLYAAALGIEILCIAAAEIGENTGLYLFGFNPSGIAIAYSLGYALAGFTTFVTILGRYNYDSPSWAMCSCCCSVLEQDSHTGFSSNLKTTFKNFAVGIKRLPY